MAEQALPSNIKELTSLRFFAAAWVPLVHFRFFFDFDPGIYSGVFSYAWLGVEWFFALSGFILCHAYGDRPNLKYGSFLWARLSRIYPVHLFTLAVMVVLVAALGSPAPAHAIAAHAALLQAWDVLHKEYLNFPAWSISAEWFAYLLFPVALFVTRLFAHRERLFFALTFSAALICAFTYVRVLRHEFNGETVAWGFIRIIPSFAVGCAMYQLTRMQALTRRQADLGFLTCVALALGAAIFFPMSWSILPGLWGTIYFAAQRSRAPEVSILRRPAIEYLGRVSFSFYMTHWPLWSLLLLFGHGFAHLHRLPQWAAIPAYLAILPISMTVYHFIEKPARAWMHRHDPFRTRAAAHQGDFGGLSTN